MPSVRIPDKEAQYASWITNFAAVATTNAVALGLTTGQTSTMTALAAAFSNAFDAVQLEKVEYASKLADKSAAKQASLDLFRSYASMLSRDPNVSGGLKASLGITVAPTPVAPLVPPTELTVTPTPTGINKLSWKRNGNAKAVTFVIEARTTETAEWTIVGVSGATKFEHEGQTPGQTMIYQVCGQRGSNLGPASLPGTAYPPAEEGTVLLKAAA